MKIGTLVKFTEFLSTNLKQPYGVGLVIENGVYIGNRDVMVLWNNGITATQISKTLEVISVP